MSNYGQYYGQHGPYGPHGRQFAGMQLPGIETMGPRGYWYGSAADGLYGADQSRMRTRPDGYYPFQSILEPDGRHAYNSAAPRYPQFYGSSYAPSQDWFMNTQFPFGLPIHLPFEMHMR